jgi:hypothetical protein
MNNQLGSDEDRKCDEESDMYFNVVLKGKPAEFSCRGAEDVQEQQRQPYDQRDSEQPTLQEL